MSNQSPLPLPAELPEDIKSAILSFVPFKDEADPLVQRLVDWFDGRHPDELLKCLDALRSRQAYPLSIGVLEAAWNSDLTEDRLGHIAEDWIGTVLHGLGDRAGAAEVAAHIAKDAMKRGPAFANDLAHLLLGWEMYSVARPLVEYAGKELPGDLSAQFNLGVSRKLNGDWSGARQAFEIVVQHRKDDKATLWNLGIVTTALEDWSAARQFWTALGFVIPETDGDFAAEGELTPVRLATSEGPYEVLWGHRLCPARIRLKGIPLGSSWAGFDDDLLIDGVTTGQVEYDGKQMPVYTALSVARPAGRKRYGLRTVGPVDSGRLEQLVQFMDYKGFAYADWRFLGTRTPYAVGLAPKSEEELQAWMASIDEADLSSGEWIHLDSTS